MRDPETGKWGKKRKLNLSDLKKHMDEYFVEDFDKCKPGAGFNKYLWEVMVPAEPVRTRISKGIRKAEEMDHDDAHLNIPLATPAEIDGLCTGPSGGKKYFTNEGYANGLAGYGQVLNSLSYSIDDDKDPDSAKNKMLGVRDAINSFIRLDAILDNRLHRDKGDHYARLDDRQYQRHTVVDKLPLKEQLKQMRNLILEVGKAYGEDWGWLYGTVNSFDKAGVQKQKEYETKVENLKEHINELFKKDNGQKILETVKSVRGTDKLVGIDSYKHPEGEDYEKMMAARVAARAKFAHGAHGGH
jgi:hypothetical protein